VAPTSRIAASRRSRCRHATRVTTTTRITIGTSTSIDPVKVNAARNAVIAAPVGRTPSKPWTSPTERTPSSCSGVRPMIATSSSSWASPAGPMVIVTRPGNRASSSSSGVDASSRIIAGDAATSSGPGARDRPGGTGGSAPSAAR
jgi:hypothetical protein